MKKKTIQRIIKTKINQWLDSIEDQQVKAAAKKDVIVTGGCIASMFLQERVNDYDVYFRTRKTTIAVANYYINKYTRSNKAEHKDGRKIKLYVDEDKRDRVYVHIQSAGMVAENTQDTYEYFETTDPDAADQYVEDAVSIPKDESSKVGDTKKDKFRPVFITSNAITLSDKIQVVTRFYGNPDEIHENYDFVHCMNYWSPKDGLVLKTDALTALLSKELKYVGSLYPFCSIVRTRKFIRRGWTINAGQYLKMAIQLSELDLTDIPTLYDQLIGVDIAYFMEVISLIKEKQSESENKSIDATYLMAIIDKIFD